MHWSQLTNVRTTGTQCHKVQRIGAYQKLSDLRPKNRLGALAFRSGAMSLFPARGGGRHSYTQAIFEDLPEVCGHT